MKSSFFWNSIIVLAAILVVLWPVVAYELSEEIARWHLAAAANADQLNIGDRSQSLERAKQWSKDIMGQRDYWLLLLEDTLDNNPSKLPELISYAKTKNPEFAALGTYAVTALQAEGKFELAVRVLEESLSEEARKYPQNLNFLAYMRALAGIELDTAREDVNQALSYAADDPALRDTRAWVLYKLGEYEDALDDANFAVSETESLRTSNPLRFLEDWTAEQMQVEPPETNSETDAEDSSAGQTEIEKRERKPPAISMQEYQEGVLRYHRGRILEALGRTEEMQEDWDWLKKRNLPISDSLY